MNKIFSLILAAVLAAPAYAAYYTPDQIKALQDKLAAATKDYQKVDLEARIAVFSMDNPASFDVIIASIKPICAKYSMPEIKAREKACQIACFHFNRKFIADAYKIALEDKTIWIWRLIVNHKKQLGLSDQAYFDLLAQTVLDRIEKDPQNIQKILNHMLSIAPNCDPAAVKNTLQKMNRLLTPYLLKNKARWEPAIALIRTALETY